MKKHYIRIGITLLLAFALFQVLQNIHDHFYHISGAARADFIVTFTALESEPYQEKVLLTAMFNGKKAVVTEEMTIQISCDDLRFWNSSMPAADLDGTPFPHSGLISIFSIQGDIVRYVSIDGIVLEESMTHKYITYTGYEDNDLSSAARATLDPASRIVTYSEDQNYFDDLEAQLKNAEKYLNG